MTPIRATPPAGVVCSRRTPLFTKQVREGGTVAIEPETLHHLQLLDEPSAFFVESTKVEASA